MELIWVSTPTVQIAFKDGSTEQDSKQQELDKTHSVFVHQLILAFGKLLNSETPCSITTLILNEKSKFEKWINNRWERKEKDLKLYYESDEKIIHPFKNNLHVVFSSRCIPSMKIVLSILLTGVASYLYFSRFKFFVWTIFIGLQLLINICFDGVHQLEKRIRVSKKKTR